MILSTSYYTILVVMDPGRLPQLARALGEAMREFRKAVSGEYEGDERERRREQAENK